MKIIIKHEIACDDTDEFAKRAAFLPPLLGKLNESIKKNDEKLVLLHEFIREKNLGKDYKDFLNSRIS